MKVGLFGGSFDPVHLGHLVIAQEALWQLGLDRVLFIPTAHPPHKPLGARESIAHRLAMVRLAIEGLEGCETADAESRSEPAYTVDTLRTARRLHGPEVMLYLLLGEDSLCDLSTWKEPDQILQLAALTVYPRPGEARVSDIPHRRLSGPRIEISSTWVRDRLGRGEPVRYWVPEPVREYIARHGLYRAVDDAC